MNNLRYDIDDFSAKFKAARRAAGLNQSDLAKKIGASRDLIVRIEAGENVGIHSVLAALSHMGSLMNIDLRLPPGVKKVNNLDDYYSEFIRPQLEVNLKARPNVDRGFVPRGALKNARILNWNKAGKV